MTAAQATPGQTASTNVTLEVTRGSLYIDRETYERFFAGLPTVILLRRDDDLLVLPTRGAVAGGFLLKTRNSTGDRVVHAAEFFRAQGIDDGVDDAGTRGFTFAWSPENGGLIAKDAFRLQT